MNNVAIAPFSGLHRNLNRIFDDRLFPVADRNPNWAPRVDIRELEHSFEVIADLPGVSSDNVEVTLDKNLLTIRGSRHEEKDAQSADQTYRRRERLIGEFTRQFSLPETADGGAITARSANGVLTITIPKTAESQPRTIEIEHQN